MSCYSLETKAKKFWPYDQYYLGEKDEEGRKDGYGEYHWSGAEGLFHSNVRWGPGVESHSQLREDVGFWRGTQLVRLAWKPDTMSVAPDFYTNSNGHAVVESKRIILTVVTKKIGETNSAIELLKQCGADPKLATERWAKLYPKYCTDVCSKLFQADVFERSYFMGNNVPSLIEEDDDLGFLENDSQGSPRDNEAKEKYFTWNNNEMMVHMMKHAYKHEMQRTKPGIDLSAILSGARNKFKPPNQYELNCRTLLMACYLGHIKSIFPLLTDCGVRSDVADAQGNTAIMYATCGDQCEIIHYLVEAGSDVDSYNDNCCSPLAVALMRYSCIKKGIAVQNMVQSLLPPLPIAPLIPKVCDWKITRNEAPAAAARSTPNKLISKMKLNTIKDQVTPKKKSEMKIPSEFISNEPFCEAKRINNNIMNEYLIRITDIISHSSDVNPIPYLFEISDLGNEIDSMLEEEKKKDDKKKKSKSVATNVKQSTNVTKTTKTVTNASGSKTEKKDDTSSVDEYEKLKQEMLNRVMLTILELLSHGAKLKLVQCPQPALFLAIISDCNELVQHLISYGADVNETYPQTLGYMALDVAISRPLTKESLAIVEALLKNGATTNHHLHNGNLTSSEPEVAEELGPTLLHVLIYRKVENESEEEIRRQMISLLLEYNCDPAVQFKGQSAIDHVLMKQIDLLDNFINCPKTNLNVIINDLNQSILVKMFYLPFFKTIDDEKRTPALTNLLLFGADPLLQCQNGGEKYHNLFEFASTYINQFDQPETKPEPDAKSKAKKKPKVNAKLGSKQPTKTDENLKMEYKQALELVRECARLLHIRWLQAQLAKELIHVVEKYKHRWWNVILKEYKHKKRVNLWLNASRCLEIWDILKKTRSKVYKDQHVLKKILCIVQYFSENSNYLRKMIAVTAEERAEVETEVNRLLAEHRETTSDPGITLWKRPYVAPELMVHADEKFRVCFECALPLAEAHILCKSCKLVSFCSLKCMQANIDRPNCHPCSDYLMKEYFSCEPECSEEHMNKVK